MEKIKEFSKYTDNSSLLKKAQDKVINEINNQIDEALIDALQSKGYVFKDKYELIVFIKENFRAEKITNTTIYFANDEPFLKLTYNNDINFNFSKNTAYSNPYTFELL